VRFVSAEDAYLSPTNGGPRMYINMEDYVKYTGHYNTQFQVGPEVTSTTIQVPADSHRAGGQHNYQATANATQGE